MDIRCPLRHSLPGLVVILLLLSSCGGQNNAPVIDLQEPPKVISGFHTVQKGESLYSIAWRYGWDYRELAIANGIGPPYLIYPDQKIIFTARSASMAPRPTSRDPLNQPPSPPPAVVSTLPEWRSQPPTVMTTRPQPTTVAATTLQWRWPIQGELLERFSGANTGNKGIDIKGKSGEPVRAAADGRVVYAGSGLIGYGNLLIVKHNDTYLSAYAHNQVLFKREQDQVKSGEIIAEIGATGAKSSRLHFEIRKNGKPVDPLHYLPAKK